MLPVNNLKRWLATMLMACALFTALPGTGGAQNRQAQIDEAMRLTLQAQELFHAGRYDEAILLEHQVLSLVEKAYGQEHREFATTLSNLAVLYEKRGDYGQAESLYQRARAIAEKILPPEDELIATILDNLAMLYSARGDNKRAEPLAERALAIREKTLGPNHLDVALSLNDLAALYVENEDYERAEPLLKRALAIREKKLPPDHSGVTQSLNNLAALYEGKGDRAQAVQLYERVLAIREQTLGPDHPNVAASLNNLATIYTRQGDYGRVEPLLERALTITEKALPTDHPDVVDTLDNLAAFYDAKGNYGQAVELLTRGSEIRERNLALVLAAGSEDQKQLYLDARSKETDQIISLHARSMPQNGQAARLALTMILQRKGRVLDEMTDQIGVLRQNASPPEQHLLDQLKDARSRLATLQLSGGEQLKPKEWRDEVEKLIAEVERLEAEVSRRSTEFRTQVLPVTLDAVRQAIPADAALVEIFAYHPFNARAMKATETSGALRYVAYVVRRSEDVPRWAELGDAATIDAEVEQLREVLKNPGRADLQTIARAVDERVMRPIRQLLGQTRRLFLSPDGALNLIPFAALVDESGEYLIENYSLTYLTSGRDLLRLQTQTENRNSPVVVANPTYDMPAASRAETSGGQDNQPADQIDANWRSRDFTSKLYVPLPGTAEEAAAVVKLLPQGTQVLMQEQATEAALKQVNRPGVLHIATHGFFLTNQSQGSANGNMQRRATLDTLETSSRPARRENPLLRSGLILAGAKQLQSGAAEDGVLTALETTGLDLWGTKLVVLSACETGLGDVRYGEGVYGLRRALVLAGSQTQVISLWKVSDAGTRDLMAAYYTRLQAGDGRAEALRRVQLAMLRGELKSTEGDVDYKHPYYWAAFIPSGDWRSMDGKEDDVIERRSSPRLAATLIFISGLIVLLALLVWWLRLGSMKRAT